MRILLVEDDEILTNVLVASLEQQRYVVDAIDDGKFGLEYAEGGSYDVLLIDVGLPRLDGISLCQQLRQDQCTTPILLMTAKDAPDEKIRGLDAGADDYLTKPLDLNELHARLRALLRRGEVAASSTLEIGQLRLNPVSCEANYANIPLRLTPKEYSLLELFLRHPTRVFSRGHIIEHLWTFDDPPLEDSVKAHIKGLRRRLKKVGADGWIENVYGLGYKLSPKVDGEALKHFSQETLEKQPQKASRRGDMPIEQVASDAISQQSIEEKSETSVEQQFNAAMVALWQQHSHTMAERLNCLREAEQALHQGNLTDELRQAARQAAHKLAGVLGMFGKAKGTKVARNLETTLSIPNASKSYPPAVSSLMQQLTQLLDLPETTPTPSTSPIPSSASKSSTNTSDTIQILAVDDDEIFLNSLPPMLEPWGMKVECLSNLTQFWDVLKATRPALLILDVEMPEQDGISLCQAVRNNEQWQSLPILFLTAKQDAAGKVFAAGADDYIVKPVLGPELITRITNRLDRVKLLKTLRDRDAQTGLANQVQAQRDFQKMMEGDRPYIFLLLQLTNLTTINLSYGHSAGHQVLKAWGTILRDQLPSKSLASYWGNGDFVITLPEVAKSSAQENIAEILKTLRKQIFVAPDNEKNRFQGQYSVGLSAFPDDGNTLKALYKVAYGSAHESSAPLTNVPGALRG